MHEEPDVPQVSDGRRSPFCYQTHDALDAIRSFYSNPVHPYGYGKLSTALAVYVCLTESANRHGGDAARNGFVASRKEIAELAGISVDGLDRYIATLVGVGLVEVTKEVVGKANLPNRWRLVDSPPGRAESATPSRADAAVDLRLEEELEEEVKDPPVTPPSTELDVHVRAAIDRDLQPANRPATVNRKPVKDDEYRLASLALAEFNRQAATNYTSSEWITKIVGRIREHPRVTVEGHAAVIVSVLNGKRWWDGDPSPSIVYGNAALYERNLHAAARPPDPNRPLTSDDVRRLADEEATYDVEGEAFEVVDA